MRRIDYASVATVLLEYPSDALIAPLNGSGFLVARTEGRMLTACTWSSNKWAHLAGESVVLKASVGRAGDASALDLEDGRLIERVHSDLEDAMGLRRGPLQARVDRFHRSLPQYRVGHLELIERMEASLAELPGARVAGAAYRGVGVASCIRSAETAASEIAAAAAGAREPLTSVAT
jgi:oxygen-dependent protoporphyrinogen oxidase